VVQRGLPFRKAAADYTILTVGDGLVSQVPALITSTGGRHHGHRGRRQPARRRV
jgi:flagellar biosynthesis component FlhA